MLAVYKPRRGEMPLWDFPEGTLCQPRGGRLRRRTRARLAERAADACCATDPRASARCSSSSNSTPSQHSFTLEETHADEFRRVALFDVVVNNADRKAGHCLLGSDGTIWVIDHGVCFSDEPKLRTVIWEFVGEPIPPDLLDDVRAAPASAERGALRGELGRLLSPSRARRRSTSALDDLLSSGVFPEPGPGRPYPWPPV